MYHGGGGFKHEEVYNMPTWMRHFHIGKINEYLQKQNEEYEKSKGKSEMGSDKGKIYGPDINPSSTYNF